MKIVVHALGALREEFFSKNFPQGTRISAVESVSSLEEHPDAAIFFDLEPGPGRQNIYKRLSPSPVLVNSVVEDLSAFDGIPNVARINAWPGMIDRSVLELVSRDPSTTKKIEICLKRLHWNYRFVPDIPGMVSARMIAMIINEAFYALGEKVSSREEIDIAMKTGTNYPYGPFEWTKKIGAGKILQLLQKMKEENDRYSIAPALLEEVQISA